MRKASLEIARINRCIKLKAIMTLENDQLANPRFRNMPSFDRFNYNGVDYVTVRSIPLIILDIGGDSTEWSPYKNVALTGMTRFMLVQQSKKLLTEFVETKELFFYRNNDLVVDESMAVKLQITVRASSKLIKIRPCVVEDINNAGTTYEGVILWINSVDNYAYLTIDELRYLIWELEKINLPEIATNLIQLDLLSQDDPKKVIPKKPIVEPPPSPVEPPTVFNRLTKNLKEEFDGYFTV